MKVLALIWGDEQRWASLSREEQEAVYEAYRAFAERAAGKLAGGAELAPTRAATTVRVRDDEVLVSDGPFAETKEQLGGFFVFDVARLDEAAELAARVPAATHGAIELRAAYEQDGAP